MNSAPAFTPRTGVIVYGMLLLFVCMAGIACRQGSEPDDEAAYKQYRSVLAKADSLYNSGKKIESLRYIDSLAAVEKHMPVYGKYVCHVHRAHYYNEVVNKKVAMPYADSALRILEENKLEAKYPDDYTHALLDVAGILSAQQEYDKALDYFAKAKLFAASHKNTCGMSDYSYHIGMTLAKQQKTEQAILYLKESFAEALTCDPVTWYRMQEILDNIGLFYGDLGKADSSRLFYDSTLTFIELHQHQFENEDMAKSAKAVVYRNLAFRLLDMGKTDSAIFMFRKCIRENPPTGNTGIKASAMAYIAQVYLGEKRYPEAYAALQGLDSILSTSNIPEGTNYWQQLMVTYYNGTRQFEKAVAMTQAFYEFKDSLQKKAASLRTSDVEKDVKDKEQQYQISLLKKDNELKKLYLWITVSCSGLFAVIIVLVFYNYRRSRRKNAQIRKQNEELEQLNREKDKILGVVAHDLRNPIGVISYLSDIMIEEGEERSKKEEESLGMILSASQHSMALINELLELNNTRLATILKDDVNLVAVAQECEAILQFRLKGKDQQMLIETEGDAIMVRGNKERLSRLLQNLLTNAIKFSYPGSEIRLHLQPKSDSVLITVADKGMGIPADMQPGLFNMFTGSRQKGTSGEQSFGLGLSISQQIVDEHNGRIWFESEEGKGTTFFVELPLHTTTA